MSQLDSRIQGLANERVSLAFLKRLASYALTVCQGSLCGCVVRLQYLVVLYGRTVIKIILVIVSGAKPTVASLDTLSSQFQPYAS